MKKYLTFLAILSISSFVGCTSKPEGGPDPVTQKNLDAQHAVNKCFETKDFSKIGDYIAVDAVDHGGENGDIKGLDSIKASMIRDVAGMDNMKSDLVKELADSDYVMSWYHFTGSFKNTEMGHKAGDKFDLNGVEVTRYKDGKGVEHWTFMDPKEMAKMMAGMMPPPMMKDTLKKK
jgi:hypothetical protein